MGKPFFSVIVPAHNSAEFIRNGLDSIKRQTFTDYELIVICDACTDNTYEIVKKYADYMMFTEFGRDGLARNAGIDVARGEWLLFMDDDDWWLDDEAFRTIAENVGHCNEDIMAFGFMARDFQYPGLQGYYNTELRIWPAVWNKCYRREFIGETRFPGIEFTSDLPFTNELLRKRPGIRFFEVPLYYYNYMRKGSQTEVHWRHDNEQEAGGLG